MLYAVRYEKTFSNKREERQYQKELSRQLLSCGLQREYGVPFKSLTLSAGPHGKPFFADHPARFSLSHCRGLVLCGIGKEELGVDVEPIRPFSPRLAERICTPEELAWLNGSADRDRALITLWTLKESLMKLTGRGFSYGFQNAAFSFREGRTVPQEPGAQAASYHLPGYEIAVCCLGVPPPQVILLDPAGFL